jgi:hypothetical protein
MDRRCIAARPPTPGDGRGVRAAKVLIAVFSCVDSLFGGKDCRIGSLQRTSCPCVPKHIRRKSNHQYCSFMLALGVVVSYTS